MTCCMLPMSPMCELEVYEPNDRTYLHRNLRHIMKSLTELLCVFLAPTDLSVIPYLIPMDLWKPDKAYLDLMYV